MYVPNFYNQTDAEKIYAPRLAEATTFGAQIGKGMESAPEDQTKVLLWLIDMQIDFIMPAPIGNLPVPGAIGDACRTVEFIYRNMDVVTSIAASLDQHFPFQIFHPAWWVDQNGNNPPPYTPITHEDAMKGIWKPLVKPKRSINYLKELEVNGKKTLWIWPYHCFKGSLGASLVPVLTEAIAVHAAARKAQPIYLPKGEIDDTEFYSVLEPEVKRPDHPAGGLNTAFLQFMTDFDLIYIAGQARSHCVLETMNSVTRNFSTDVIRKLRFLDDCTSSIPGFEKDTDDKIQEFVKMGMRVVKSTDPIA